MASSKNRHHLKLPWRLMGTNESHYVFKFVSAHKSHLVTSLNGLQRIKEIDKPGMCPHSV